MQLDKHELTKKEYIKLSKRLDEIWKEKYRTPWRKIDKPFQDGWFVTSTLRDDLLRSDRGLIALSILDKYKTSFVTKDVARVKRLRANPSFNYLYKLYPSPSGLHHAPVRSITQEEYDKLSAVWKTYFSRVEHVDPPKWGMKERLWVNYEFNIPRFYLEVKIVKRIVTHVQDINPELLKEEAALTKKLEPYWRTMRHSDWDKPSRLHDRGERRATKVALRKELIQGENG